MDPKVMINLRPNVLAKIEKALSDISYRDAIENSARYNNRLVVDRKTRLPFIDSQTGVAQRDCYLWMQKWQRMPGATYGQLYTYPSHKWKKKRRGYLFRDNYYCHSSQVNETSETQENKNGTEVVPVNKPETSETTNSTDKFGIENSKEAWMYAEYEDSIDLLEEDFDDPASEGDDYDEYTTRKKRRRTRRKKSDLDNDKPYACDLCEARYKTRPGLTYHYAHNHQNDGEKRSKSSTPVSMVDEDSRTSTRNNNSSGNGSSNKDQTNKPLAPPNPYCDFCLVDENEKNKIQEKMVSCSDCGRSAHPTCLQFTPQMIISVQKYRWQCIECKSCGICGTSDNDEQLLFCDDCDRGYHMYCLTPPISEPPEGSWSCHLCIEEYHKPKDQTDSSEKDQKANEKNDKGSKGKVTDESEKSITKTESNGKVTSGDQGTKIKDESAEKEATKHAVKKSDKNETDKEKKIDKSDPIEERLKNIFEGSKKESEAK